MSTITDADILSARRTAAKYPAIWIEPDQTKAVVRTPQEQADLDRLIEEIAAATGDSRRAVDCALRLENSPSLQRLPRRSF